MIGSLQLAIQGNRSGATTITTSGPESLNLVRSIQLSLPGSQSTQHSRSCSTVIFTPLIDRFFVPLFDPDSNSRFRGQFLRLPTMVLFATPAPHGAGPMTISGYAWGHIVATGPRHTVARDIRSLDTHPRPLHPAQKHERCSKRRKSLISTHFMSLCSCLFKPPAVSSFLDRTAHHVSKWLRWSPPTVAR